MAERVVRGACPHDCPDTCAMLTTVDAGGRAVAIGGDPEHPITAGFLCGKVSNYLDRVYSEQRILRPLVRAGAKGEGEFRQVELGRGARRSPRRDCATAIDSHGAESVLPYSYMGTQGAIQGGSIANRFMNAIGATELVRTICASAGIAGVAATHGVSPEVDPEHWPRRALRARLGLEPDVDGSSPVAEDPRRAPQRGPALRRRPVSQPHRPGRRRAPATAAGDRRCAGAGDDARRRRRRPRRRAVVPGPCRRL